MSLASDRKIARLEQRRQKELDEARRAGTAPPAVDKAGNIINPHVPDFMSKAPWYLAQEDAETLSHQRSKDKYNADPRKLDQRFERGVKGPASTKFRKGACTNCGAMTHTAKDCLERPRKKGAKFTNANIAPDEVIHDQNAHLNGKEGLGDFDAKRDRWDGYDPATHRKVIEEYEALEEARRKLREEEIDKGSTNDKQVAKTAKTGKRKKDDDSDDEFGSTDDSDEGEVDDEKYADDADAAGQRMDTKNRVSVRNLRIREDTAKYLRNLDAESAYYDPKTRSMREAPNPNDPDAVYAGDNFLRSSGDVVDIQKAQLFAWQSEARGSTAHLQSNPTQAHLLIKEHQDKREERKVQSSKGVLDKYGGEEYLRAAPKELLVGQTENYVEYSRSGQLIKGQERAKARSKYDEDVHPGNHTSIWGSWFSKDQMRFGYACCHSLIKQSWCAGEAGKEAASESTGAAMLESAQRVQQRRREEASASAADQQQQQQQATRAPLSADSSKANSKYGEVSEEDMDKYKKSREAFEDPMKGISSNEVMPL